MTDRDRLLTEAQQWLKRYANPKFMTDSQALIEALVAEVTRLRQALVHISDEAQNDPIILEIADAALTGDPAEEPTT
jgi:hypothetical protein